MDIFLHWIERLLGNFSGTWEGTLALFGLSILLGITHTFGPGHGKSLLLGVLVADSRRVGHALMMGLVIGITHMTDVIVLSLISIFFVSTVSLGSFSSVIGIISGSGIFFIGLYRIFRVLTTNTHDSHAEHDHGHNHDHEKQSESENLMTAFLYSLAPCPGAWILFMACLGIGEPVIGFLLLLGFTIGLLVSISSIATSIVYSLKWTESMIPGWAEKGISLTSGVLVSILGLWLLLGSGGHAH